MLPPWATLDEPGDSLVLRFERRLAHPPEKVFRAISDPDELEHWFPARVATDWQVGSAVAFTFEDMDADAPAGTVLEFDPPRLLAFTLGRRRAALGALPGGRRMPARVHPHARARRSRPAAGRGSRATRRAGTCAWPRSRRGSTARPLPSRRGSRCSRAYVERLGLGEGERDGRRRVRFRRDVVQTPDAGLGAADRRRRARGRRAGPAPVRPDAAGRGRVGRARAGARVRGGRRRRRPLDARAAHAGHARRRRAAAPRGRRCRARSRAGRSTSSCSSPRWRGSSAAGPTSGWRRWRPATRPGSLTSRPRGTRSGSRTSSRPTTTASARSPGRGCRRRPRTRCR